MNNKRPFLKLAIQKIESLFIKNKDNPVILTDIKNELRSRKTLRSKLLKNKVDNQLKKKSLNKPNKEKEENGKNLEEFLKSISIEEFVSDYNVSIRIQHAILSELSSESNYIKFDTIYDFITSDEKDQQELCNLPNFGKKSLSDLKFAIESLVKEKLNLNYLDQPIIYLMDKTINVENISADNIVVSNLGQEQKDALKNISLDFFVNNSNDVNNRTRNSILNAEKNGLLIYQNLYDFYVAPISSREELLNLENFGKGSLDNLYSSVKSLTKDEKSLFFLSDRSTKSMDISVFSSIDEMINYAITTIGNYEEQEIIKARHLNKNIATLQEIGDEFGVTRERIRQKENKALNKTKNFILMFSKDKLISNFKVEIVDYFFSNNCFISGFSAKNSVKNKSKSIGFFVTSISESLEDFLSEWFFYSDRFQGWFLNEDVMRENERNYTSEPLASIDVAIQRTEWPITLSSLSDLMHLPECVVKDKVILSNKFYLEELQNDIFVRLRKMSTKNAVRYVLRRYKREMTLEEVRKNCLDMFGLNLTKGVVANALGDLPDGLIVNTGTYALYEYLDITDKQLKNVREFSKNYLMKEQKYISAFVIFNSLKKENNFYERYGIIDTGHILFGICQDDNEFITKKGFMLGLNSNSFKGEYITLTQEIINLMKDEGRPLNVTEIMEKLSNTRCLIWSSLFSMLDNSKQNIFEKAGSKFYLANDHSHLEINDEDFLEYEFDDI